MSGGDKNRPETAIYIAHDEFIPKDASEAEHNLMRAILNSAISDMKKEGEAVREALSFFRCDDENYLFSFKSICNQLNLCPKTILSVVGLCSRSRSGSTAN